MNWIGAGIGAFLGSIRGGGILGGIIGAVAGNWIEDEVRSALRKKFPKKFAPTISPNKTLVGFIGGILGGALAGVGIYFGYNAICGDFANMYIGLPVYLLVGLVASAFSAFGDLVESAIKRERGIKDMGNIMPGHGGVLDRIDGTMITAVVVYAAFLLAGLFV